MLNFFKKQINLILLGVVLLLLYFNLISWQQNWLGWILFFSYFYFTASFWQDILRRVFGYKSKTKLLSVFAWFVIFLLLSFFAGVFLVFYKLTPVMIFSSYLMSALTSFFICKKVGRKKCRILDLDLIHEEKTEQVFKMNIILPGIYLILWLLAILILWQSSASEVLFLPWQTISRYFLPIFFVLTFISGIFLFAKYKIKLVLLIFILQSILIHTYLPFSHQNPWGGDVWRHMAVEERLSTGGTVLPVLIGDEAKWVERVNVDVPEVFVSPNQYNYSQLWGGSVLLSQTLQISLTEINKWLIPFLWSIVSVFIFYRLGWLIFGSRRKGLWLAWLSFLPFSMQALGALSLPVSLGYLNFLFVLMLWLEYLYSRQKKQKRLVYLFASIMLFGYVLHFILIWLVILCCF